MPCLYYYMRDMRHSGCEILLNRVVGESHYLCVVYSCYNIIVCGIIVTCFNKEDEQFVTPCVLRAEFPYLS